MANDPITREEMLLNAVATGETANLEPITREEMFLAKAGGQDVQTPTPITRKEMFLQAVVDNAGGGGGGGEQDHTAEDGLITGTLTSYTNDRVESVKNYLFWESETLKNVSLPNAVSIGSYAFGQSQQLSCVEIPKAKHIGEYCFHYCTNLLMTSLPENLQTVGQSAFTRTKVSFNEIGRNVKTLGDNCFNSCSDINTIAFKGAPYIGATVFSGCTNLLTINVPWGEGDIDGAPWGAVNATINYNADMGYGKDTLFGTYLFNETISVPPLGAYGIAFKYFAGQRDATRIREAYDVSSWAGNNRHCLQFFRVDTQSWVSAYDFDTEKWWEGYEDDMRIIIFETEQSMDAEFVAWFKSNTTKMS